MNRWQRRFNQNNGRPSKLRQRSAEVTPEHNPMPVTERFTYDVYGRQKPAEGKLPVDTSDGWNYQFQGGRADPKADLINLGQRDINLALARWIDHEPIGYVEGQNVYLFVNDDSGTPINPLGE